MVLLLVLTISILVRVLVGNWGYSGFQKPPMYGDFEAQRHWMEVTIHLPVGDWYRQTTENNLQYWGLDYPPLTAYVSQGFGTVANVVCPELVAWKSSRGHESAIGKHFMRASVILSDVIVFLPAIVQSFAAIGEPALMNMAPYQLLTLLLLANSPGLLLIDHGHFQYNGVCLGLAMIGSFLVSHGWDVVGSVFFCLALNFKQMALYYAPAFFFPLLRKCFVQRTILKGLMKFLSLGIAVLSTFAVLWAPFCIFHSEDETCLDGLLHVLQRQFPFARGIFEDKVANLWYTASVFVDFRQFLSTEQLVLCSLSLTICLLFPLIVSLLFVPLNFHRMTLGLLVSALSFFLASFQVHEKSILLAAIPALFLLNRDSIFSVWFQLVSCFSMFPLLRKDGQVVPYWCCVVLFVLSYRIHRTIFVPILSPATDSTAGTPTISSSLGRVQNKSVTATASTPEVIGKSSSYLYNVLVHVIIGGSVLGMIVLHVAEAYVPPPVRYPDLYPALFAMFSAANFSLAYLYCTSQLLQPLLGSTQVKHQQQVQLNKKKVE